eukprot:TRINITY_DN37038_c0_g1_i3.p1 TRINITY_DN37038_c0_g1~~TRINITY_DN37038_c0_g1_i3.p1  ORF type:complete len:109 (-),score=7.85 TRINITY_DN37038_c0_g1_i3:65-391(-)
MVGQRCCNDSAGEDAPGAREDDMMSMSSLVQTCTVCMSHASLSDLQQLRASHVAHTRLQGLKSSAPSQAAKRKALCRRLGKSIAQETTKAANVASMTTSCQAAANEHL